MLYQDPLSNVEIIADNQALFDELERQYNPLDTTGNPFRRTLRVGDVSIWVSDAVWMPLETSWGGEDSHRAELWYLQCFDHYNHGGETRLEAVWARLRGKERNVGQLDTPNWELREPYEPSPSYGYSYGGRYRNQYAPAPQREKVWSTHPRAIDVWFNLDLMKQANFYLRKEKSATTDPPITTYLIRPRLAKVGDTNQNFPFFIPKTFTSKQRNWAFFQQLRTRIQLPFLPEWAGLLWESMEAYSGAHKMIQPMKDFGTVQGYWIRLNQQWIAKWQTEQIVYGKLGDKYLRPAA